jgi:hypothetical protein
LTLQIDYGALSLSSASKLRFRHMRRRAHAGWVDGRRRQVLRNLQPNYRFRLEAASDAWTENQVSWTFTVLPLFGRTYCSMHSAAIAVLGF